MFVDKCPYCEGTRVQGTSGAVASLTDEWDFEQSAVCLECGREYVTVFVALRNITMEKSSVFIWSNIAPT